MPEQSGVARTLAMGTEESRPAWLRATEGEHRWWIALALTVAIGVQFALPDRFVLHPAYVSPAVEAALLVVLILMHPDRQSQRTRRLRMASQLLLAIIAITNTIAVVLLIRTITTGHHVRPDTLLVGGGEIWLTNTIVFALWYWEYDRGGPAARAHGRMDVPDLLFPQLTDEHLAHDWEPMFVDYLYVSFTNSTAFSPTDTMPLSRWAKLLFALQAIVSLVTVALIAARAVNILPSG